MKKILMAMALAAACLSLAACDGSQTSNSSQDGGSSSQSNVSSEVEAAPAEKTASLLSAVDFPEMRELESADDLTAILGIDAAILTDYSAYICPSGMSPDEFGIFVTQDEAAASSIKTALENRIQYQSDTFRDYPLAAAEVYKLDDAFVQADGNVVYYAICADNTTARDILG